MVHGPGARKCTCLCSTSMYVLCWLINIIQTNCFCEICSYNAVFMLQSYSWELKVNSWVCPNSQLTAFTWQYCFIAAVRATFNILPLVCFLSLSYLKIVISAAVKLRSEKQHVCSTEVECRMSVIYPCEHEQNEMKLQLQYIVCRVSTVGNSSFECIQINFSQWEVGLNALLFYNHHQNLSV